MGKPIVSIGMPVYNGEQFIEAGIRSNLAQTMGDIELIISDNASTDRTETICRDYAASDKRVRYRRNAHNIGAAANYNLLVRHALGPYFRWSNCDDLVSPRLVELTLPVLRSRLDVMLAYGRTSLVDGNDRLIEPYEDNLDLQDELASDRFRKLYQRVGLTNVIYGLMRTHVLKETALMGSGQIPAGDVRFMAGLVLRGKFVELPETLFYRRMHPGAFSYRHVDTGCSVSDTNKQENFWMSSESKWTLPHLRAEFADATAVIRAPLPWREKLRLLDIVIRQSYWHRKQIMEDFRVLFAGTRANS